MCVNNLSKVALDSAAAGIEPAISSRKSKVQRQLCHYAIEPSCDFTTPWSSALATGKGTHLVQTLPSGVQGNPRPGTMLSKRDVHSSFHCSQPFSSPFRCSWWFGRTQNKPITRQPGILCSWSDRLEQSATGHSFSTDIINFQKHAQDTYSRSYFTNCFTEYEQRTLYGTLVVILAMLQRFTNCRFIIITLFYY